MNRNIPRWYIALSVLIALVVMYLSDVPPQVLPQASFVLSLALCNWLGYCIWFRASPQGSPLVLGGTLLGATLGWVFVPHPVWVPPILVIAGTALGYIWARSLRASEIPPT